MTRRTILGIVAVLAATSCGQLRAAPSHTAPPLLVQPTGSPFVQVTAAGVSGLVPEGWSAVALDPASPHQGFFASPDPSGWDSDSSSTGMTATWIDATRVGLPSDAYYFAATGPLLSELISSPGCHAERQIVVADHVPAAVSHGIASPADYVARGEGVCRPAGGAAWGTRWSYFVAAPGFGPAKGIGIPQSGLYVAVAVTRDTRSADERLAHLMAHLRFGDAGVVDIVRAARVPLLAVP